MSETMMQQFIDTKIQDRQESFVNQSLEYVKAQNNIKLKMNSLYAIRHLFGLTEQAKQHLKSYQDGPMPYLGFFRVIQDVKLVPMIESGFTNIMDIEPYVFTAFDTGYLQASVEPMMSIVGYNIYGVKLNGTIYEIGGKS